MKVTVEAVLQAMPGWWGPYVRWAARWSVHGPGWVHPAIRLVPLWAGGEVCKLRVRQLQRGDGGCGPHAKP